MTTIKNLSLVGAGAAGLAALTFGAAGIASAQDDDPVLVDPATEDVEAADDADTHRFRHGDRHERIQEMIDQLVADGVITQDQVDDAQAVRDAVHAEREAQRAEKYQELADVLGITVEELQAAREEGTTIAELAGDNLDAVVDLYVERATERINSAVESGRITQEQADEKLEGLEDRVTTRLEEGGGFGRRGEGKHRSGGRGGHHHAEAEEAAFSA